MTNFLRNWYKTSFLSNYVEFCSFYFISIVLDGKKALFTYECTPQSSMVKPYPPRIYVVVSFQMCYARPIWGLIG